MERALNFDFERGRGEGGGMVVVAVGLGATRGVSPGCVERVAGRSAA